MSADQKKGPIWEAIQHACGDLPEGYEIRLHMEKGFGGVEWSDPDGFDYSIEGEGFVASDIEEAIDAIFEHAGIEK